MTAVHFTFDYTSRAVFIVRETQLHQAICETGNGAEPKSWCSRLPPVPPCRIYPAICLFIVPAELTEGDSGGHLRASLNLSLTVSV